MFDIFTPIDLAGARPNGGWRSGLGRAGRRNPGLTPVEPKRRPFRWPGAAIARGAAGLVLVFAVLGAPASDRGVRADEPEIREIIAGVPRSWPPQYSVDANGDPAGFAIDVMDEIAARAGLRVKYKVMDNFAEVNRELDYGGIDLIPNSGITPERVATSDFTATVETFVVSIFVREDTIDIKSAADLRGRMVGVVETNIGRKLMRNRNDVVVVAYQDAETALFSLVAGHVDAIVFPQPVLLKLARQVGMADHITVVGAPLKEVKRGIRLRKGQPEILAALNQAVNDFVGTPAYQEIYVKWYGSPAQFWTLTRSLAATGLAVLLVLIVMGWWRFRSIVELNQELGSTITERDSAVQEFRKSEERFRAFTEHSPSEIHIKDADGRFILINRQSEEMFGMTDEEAKGKTSYDIFPKDVADAFAAQDQAVLKSGQTASRETKILRGGKIHIMRTVKFPIKDTVGKTVAVGTISSDITELEQISEALVKSESRLQQAVRLTKIGHRVWDVVGARSVYCSDEQARIHGVTVAEYLAQADTLEGMAEFAHPQDRGAFRSVMLALLAEGLGYELEYRLQLPGGEIRYVREFGQPVFGDNGDLIEMHGTVQDITEFKRAGEQLHQAQKSAPSHG